MMMKTETKPIYTAEQLEARIEVLKSVRASWKGKSEYAATIDMEIWSMSLVARLLRAALDGPAIKGDSRLAHETVEKFVAYAEEKIVSA
jgi:hypothetical protein